MKFLTVRQRRAEAEKCRIRAAIREGGDSILRQWAKEDSLEALMHDRIADELEGKREKGSI